MRNATVECISGTHSISGNLSTYTHLQIPEFYQSRNLNRKHWIMYLRFVTYFQTEDCERKNERHPIGNNKWYIVNGNSIDDPENNS